LWWDEFCRRSSSGGTVMKIFPNHFWKLADRSFALSTRKLNEGITVSELLEAHKAHLDTFR
jgi:hypothetical protein